MAKALVKAARQATKASAEREARGERADGWFERAVDWAREKARAQLRKDDDAPETVVAFAHTAASTASATNSSAR